MPANKKAKNTAHTPKNTNAEARLPQDLIDKIANWKEMFPQYKQSTNEDIIAIFEDYNDDFEAAVYGAMNGLITIKPAGTWQSVGQKKKKKANAQRTQSANQKNNKAALTTQSDTNSRARKTVNPGSRGQPPSTRGSTNRKKEPSKPRNINDPKPSNSSNSAVAPVGWANTKSWLEADKTQDIQNVTSLTNSPSGNPSPPTATQPIQNAQPPPVQNSSLTQNTGERQSYANAARSRQAWNPNKPVAQAAKKETVQLSDESNRPDTTPIQQQTQVQPPSNAPVSGSSQNFPQQSPRTNTSTQNPPETTIQSNPTYDTKSVEKPRVGVLLPTSNFDSVSFQFGNLGIRDEDLLASSRPSSETSASPRDGQSISTVNATQHTSNKLDSNIQKADPNVLQSQYPENSFPPHLQYPHQYSMYPGMDSEHMRGVPMAYFPGDSYQTHMNSYMRPEGKYRGNQSGGRGEPNSKFSSDSAQTLPGQPIHYGYTMYPPYQFPGGSYGNQFYGYGFNPKGPYSQNYGNVGMPYIPDDESSKQHIPGGHYPQNPQDTPHVSGNTKTNQQIPEDSKQTSTNKGGNPVNQRPTNSSSMEGNFSQDYRNLHGDIYGMEQYNSPFMSPPFAHPGQYQLPPQQPNSRNYN